MKKIIKQSLTFLKSKEGLTLIFLFFIGLILRTINLWDNINFGYDQARDAQRIYDIIHLGNLKLVGPETDIPGVFHGALYYYLLIPSYLISNFDPNFGALFLTLLNLLGIIIIYKLSLILFHKRGVGVIAAFIWAVSYEQANFSRFLSNPSLMPIFILLFFYFLAVYAFEKKDFGLYLSSIFLGFCIHANLYLVYLIIFYPIYYYALDLKITIKKLLITILSFMAVLSPFIMGDLKWNFMQSHSLLIYLNKQSGVVEIIDQISNYLQKISLSIYYTFFSFSLFIGLLMFFVIFIYVTKKNYGKKEYVFLIIWLLGTVPLFAFKSGVHNTSWINTTFQIAAIFIVSFFIAEIYKLNSRLKALAIILIFIIAISNLNLFFKYDFTNNSLFELQNLKLIDEKKMIDYTYSSSNTKPFSVCALTNPLFVNTLWSYLYYHYGNVKFGYLPTWSGQRQYINENMLPYDKNKLETSYLIIEPLGPIPEIAKQVTVFAADKKSTLVEEKKFGDLIVQKRKLKQKGEPFADTQGLNKQQIQSFEEILGRDPRYYCVNDY